MAYILKCALIVFTFTWAASAETSTYVLKGTLPVHNCTGLDVSESDHRIFTIDVREESLAVISIFDTQCMSQMDEMCNFSAVPWCIRLTGNRNALWTALYYGGDVTEVALADCAQTQSINVGNWPVKLIFDDNCHYLFVGENHPGGSSNGPGSLHVIDTWTGADVATIPLNGQASYIARAPKDRYLYVIATRGASGATETLYKIDSATFSVADSIDLGDLAHDVGLSVAPDQKTVYVPDPANMQVRLINTATMQVSDSLTFNYPVRHFWIAPSGDHAIASGDFHSTLDIYDLQERVTTQHIEVGIDNQNWKREVKWSNDGKTAYIALATEQNSVAIIEAQGPACPNETLGDLDGDSDADADDMAIMRALVGNCASLDVDNNDTIDVFDLFALLSYWGNCQ